MKIKDEDLMLFYLEKEGLDNPNDFFKTMEIKKKVINKLNDENSIYYKLNKYYKELEELEETGGLYNDLVALLKKIKEINPYDPYIAKRIIFTGIDLNKDYKDQKLYNKEEALKQIKEELLNAVKEMKSSNSLEIEEKMNNFRKELSLDHRDIEGDIKKYQEFNNYLLNECLNDSRMFNENKELISSFSNYYLGRMYLESSVILYNSRLSFDKGNITNNNIKFYEDIINNLNKYQKDNITIETTYEHLFILDKSNNYSKYNELVNKLDDSYLINYVFKNYESVIEDIDKKSYLVEMMSLNKFFVISFIYELFKGKCFYMDREYHLKTFFTKKIKKNSLKEAYIATGFLIRKLLEDYEVNGKEFTKFLPLSLKENVLLFSNENTYKVLSIIDKYDFKFSSDEILNELPELNKEEVLSSLNILQESNYITRIVNNYTFSKDYYYAKELIKKLDPIIKERRVKNVFELIKNELNKLGKEYLVIEKILTIASENDNEEYINPLYSSILEFPTPISLDSLDEDDLEDDDIEEDEDVEEDEEEIFFA